MFLLMLKLKSTKSFQCTEDTLSIDKIINFIGKCKLLVDIKTKISTKY